ncbi:MAG: exodeoxyribonuclease VII large subunit [Campylobacterota bacterium]
MNTLTVSQLNTQLKSLIETTFMHLSVEGEIGSVTYHTSGHIYFNIKDAKSSIKCVMFRSNARALKFRLEAGQKIIVSGSLSVYTPRGEYQLYAANIEPYGAGALALAYEQLKKKLQQKGYFENKQSLPKHIKKIAIVTSKSGAAIADMLKVIDKRWPLVEVKVIDTLVQGQKCAPEIAKHIAYADSLDVDVIIVGRGGGSLEDLWGFNEEVVADAIHSAKTPLVSAVGHEVDVMISDMVADLRAPTPSAAIEMILPDKGEVLFVIDENVSRYKRAIEQKLHTLQNMHDGLLSEYGRYNPKRRLDTTRLQIEELAQRLHKAIEAKVEYCNNKLAGVKREYELSHPQSKIPQKSAFVYKDGKKVSLSEIEKQQKFVLEDASVSMQVQCLDKKSH